MQNRKWMLIIAVATVVGMGTSAAGQIVYGQPTTGNLRMIYSRWSEKSDMGTMDTDQIMVPLSGFIPLQDNLELRFYGASVSTSVDADGEDFTLSGLTDMRLQFNQSLASDRFLLSLGLNLPTGKKSLSLEEERPVMGVLTQNYLSFPVRRMGEGFGVNLLAGAAATSGEIRFGGIVSYQINGAYEAYEDEGDYKPGNMFSLSASADAKASEWVFAADATFTTYSTDKVDDRKVFAQSDQLDLHAGAEYESKSYSFSGDVRYLIRGRNTRYDITEAVYDQLKIFGNEFFMAGRFAYAPDERWFIAPLADLRLIAGNEYEFGSSRVIGLGLEAGRKISTGLNLGAGFKYHTGSADDGYIDLSGFQISAGLMAAF